MRSATAGVGGADCAREDWDYGRRCRERIPARYAVKFTHQIGMPELGEKLEYPERKRGALDLEVKDANLIFESVWAKLAGENGAEGLNFPKEIFWLNGAPGAGKGTQTEFMMKFRDITAPPVVVSALLGSPEAQKLIDAGMMVGDREVTELVFRELLKPVNQTGVVVDGFPRTKVQVHCLKLLHERLLQQRRELGDKFHKPGFHIVVLFVDEAESVRRQLLRGELAREHNAEVEASGVGSLIEIRRTDMSEEAARNRYRTFKEVTYESLSTLREVFHYHYINAHGTIEAVKDRIVAELRYQSSLELDEATYDRISRVPVASSLALHARQDLIGRLEDYEHHHTELFEEVMKFVETKFVPIIRTHSISGKAYINSENPLLNEPKALAMIVDIFSERGYHAVVDIRFYGVPVRLDPETYELEMREKKVWRFILNFPGSEIRRGH